MPWQAVPPLVIIGGAFAVSGLLLNGFDKLTLGRVRYYLLCFKMILHDFFFMVG